MRRLTLLLLLLPVAALAQTSTTAPASAAPTTRQTTPRPAPKTGSAPATTAGTTSTAQKPASTTSAAKPAAPVAPAAPAPLSDEQKVIYAIGLLMEQSLEPFDMTQAELDIIARAVADGAKHKPLIDLDEFGPQIQPLALARRERIVAKSKAAGLAFIDTAAAEAGAVKTTSGMVYREITAGTGASPLATDTVKVNYRGTLLDGTEFDSSYKRNEPMEFQLNRVIGCWTEGVQKMKIGGKARLVCPSSLAYGDAGSPPIPGGATLVFEVELVDVIK